MKSFAITQKNTSIYRYYISLPKDSQTALAHNLDANIYLKLHQ